MAALHAAVDAGVNFIDTADVYGDGRSERLVARLRRERAGERIYVATKAGRRLPTQTREGYTRENLNAWVDRSLQNLETDAIDLLQLHCPHPAVYDSPEVFEILDNLIRAGKIRYYGVSVETVDEACAPSATRASSPCRSSSTCSASSPRTRFFAAARERQVGILARVPLASGLLTGKLEAPIPRSRPTTTGGSIATASASTRARRSPACPTRSACRRSRSCARSCPRARP